MCFWAGFNSQPPEGGWMLIYIKHGWHSPFQLTAARRRLEYIAVIVFHILKFQLTAARRRLDSSNTATAVDLRFQLTAARRRLGFDKGQCLDFVKFQLTAARRRLGQRRRCMGGVIMFQLTAARRRLDNILPTPNLNIRNYIVDCFNSQPPEGGWNISR